MHMLHMWSENQVKFNLIEFNSVHGKHGKRSKNGKQSKSII